MALLHLPSQYSVYSVLSFSAVKFTVVLSHLSYQRCCLPVCPLNQSDQPIPDPPDSPPGSLGISEAPGRW